MHFFLLAMVFAYSLATANPLPEGLIETNELDNEQVSYLDSHESSRLVYPLVADFTPVDDSIHELSNEYIEKDSQPGNALE